MKIVFFDGVCHFCNGTVNVLQKIDKKHILNYTPLQGSTAKKKLPKKLTESVDSIIYMDGADLSVKSTAVLKIIKSLGGLWSIFGIFLVIPRGARDAVYDIIARNRYKWFGKQDHCRIPTPKERDQFLD